MSMFRNRFTFVLIATFVIVAVVIAMLVKRGLAASAAKHESQSFAAQKRGRVQIVRFTFYDAGIYPQEARANPGPITLAIEDLTGSSSAVLIERIEPGVGATMGTMNKPSNQLRSRAEFSLGVGRYQVVDPARPDNRAVLIVEP
jgi:hypothetical protein